jgi:hypothetical protein
MSNSKSGQKNHFFIRHQISKADWHNDGPDIRSGLAVYLGISPADIKNQFSYFTHLLVLQSDNLPVSDIGSHQISNSLACNSSGKRYRHSVST